MVTIINRHFKFANEFKSGKLHFIIQCPSVNHFLESLPDGVRRALPSVLCPVIAQPMILPVISEYLYSGFIIFYFLFIDITIITTITVQTFVPSSVEDARQPRYRHASEGRRASEEKFVWNGELRYDCVACQAKQGDNRPKTKKTGIVSSL